jgi:hypothetical protein
MFSLRALPVNVFSHSSIVLVTRQRLMSGSTRSDPVSELLQLFAVREIADRTANKKPLVIVNLVSPGLCTTDLTRSTTGTESVVMNIMQKLVA